MIMNSASYMNFLRTLTPGVVRRKIKYKFQIRNLCTSKINNGIQEKAELSNGREILFESGNYAKMADGAAVAKVGETSVLVTAVSKIRQNSQASFMPLTVDYRQKYAAAGRIPTNYFKRELAPTEKEILTSRVIDRSIRPLFPNGFFHDTQITCQLLAVDGLQEPDVISINAASAALALSPIPWNGPVGAVRVGIVKGNVITFPTRKELVDSDLNLLVVASEQSQIVMLEGSGKPVLLQDLQKAIKTGVKESQLIVNLIKSIAIKHGKPKTEFKSPFEITQEVLGATRSLCSTRLRDIFCDASHNKLSRDNAITEVRQDIIPKLIENFPDMESSLLFEAFNVIFKEIFRNLILDENIRCDGRGVTDLRPISCSVNLFSPLHGSSVFQRGQTQVQSTVAYDAPDRQLGVDPLLEVTGGARDKNFFLHYSFPSFANNEVSRGGALTRREVGHGALASKALLPIIPKDTPFSVLLTATVMESNGSSSMATVCAGSLALLDAGLNIVSPAAGVAMGLVTTLNENKKVEKYQILTDILGIEDYLGDMDFKIAGTKHGITALQADIKLIGVPIKVIMEALGQAFTAKNDILEIMNEVISVPRVGKSNLPVSETKEIPGNKRAALMGIGGINIKRMQADIGVQITWLDSSRISIFAPNKSAMDEALECIDEKIKAEPTLEFGSIYTAKIVDVRQQGVMVVLYEGMTPVLLHNSQLDSKKIYHPSALNLEVGQEMKVKYFGRDPTSGHMRISKRALMGAKSLPSNLLAVNSNGS